MFTVQPVTALEAQLTLDELMGIKHVLNDKHCLHNYMDGHISYI